MVQINTSLWSASLGGVQAQGRIRTALNISLERMYTGFRINRASDDPHGLVDAVDVGKQITSAEAAIRNNQASFTQFSRIDTTVRTMLSNLLDVRDAIQKSIGITDPVRQQTYLDEVTSLLETHDRYARNTKIGGRAVLAGTAEISLGSTAADLLDVDATHIRRAGRGSYLTMSFQGAKAAERASIRDTYNVPGADSQLRITTDQGSTTLTITAATGAVAAAAQINTAVADIGAYAFEDAGDIVIATAEYGDDHTIQFDHLAGPNIFGATPLADTGVDGSIGIGGRLYSLKDDLRLDYSDLTVSGSLQFDGAKVGVDVATGAAPADASLQLQPSGGIFLQFGADQGALQGARVGLRDHTTEALGLNAIVQNAQPDYMFTDPDAAIETVMDAYDTLRRTTGEVGAFMRDELEGMNTHLKGMLEELYDRQSDILDTDQAYEAARLAKMQMLSQAGVNAMSADISTRRGLMTLFDVMLAS